MTVVALKKPKAETDALASGLLDDFKKLTVKQRSFITHYAITRNGVEAAKMAGYTGDYMTLAQTASQNLKNPQILQALDLYMRPKFEEQGITVDRTLRHLADIAYAPWADHIMVKERKGRIVNVRMQMSAKLKALEILTKMLRLTSDKEIDIQQFIDQSQNIHVHARTADEARKALLDYLAKRKTPSHRAS